MLTLCCGPSSAARPASASGLPMVKRARGDGHHVEGDLRVRDGLGVRRSRGRERAPGDGGAQEQRPHACRGGGGHQPVTGRHSRTILLLLHRFSRAPCVARFRVAKPWARRVRRAELQFGRPGAQRLLRVVVGAKEVQARRYRLVADHPAVVRARVGCRTARRRGARTRGRHRARPWRCLRRPGRRAPPCSAWTPTARCLHVLPHHVRHPGPPGIGAARAWCSAADP